MYLSLVILGSPPQYRGSDVESRDLDLQLANAFPSCALFVEKPISGGPVEACWRVALELSRRSMLVGVGYVFRYLKGKYTHVCQSRRAYHFSHFSYESRPKDEVFPV